MQADLIRLSLQKHASTSLTEQIVAGLQAQIEQGELRPGQRLPSVRQFALAHQVSVSTTVDAYERLVARGLLLARRGAGFFVPPKETQSSVKQTFIAPSPIVDSSWLLAEIFSDERVPIKAGCGWLPAKWLNGKGLHQAKKRMARTPAVQQTGYGSPYGYLPLRQTIAQFLARWSLEVAPEQILTTHGATQALDLILRTLVKPGDTVFMEEPGYVNLITLLKLMDIRLVSVPRISNGVATDVLDALAQQHRPKLFFTNTVLQNPTGTSYTPACAMRVLQSAERYGFWVVEDDLFRELAPSTDPMLAALDGLQRVIYIGGFSKTIAPALRLGYIACQPELARELVHTKMVTALTSSEITERLAHTVLMEGHHRRHTERLSAALLHTQARVCGELEKVGLSPFAAPRGGVFIFASFPHATLSAKQIADYALQKGIWLTPGEFFYLSEPGKVWFRFNVAYSDVPELFEFFDNFYL